MLHIGRTLDSNEDVYIDVSKSRVILICGKRGSGKSYTLGVLVEEVFKTKESIVLIIDPMGIYHTISLPNNEQEQLVWKWGASPKGLPVTVVVPGNPEFRYGGEDIIREMSNRGVRFQPLRINPSDISPEGWCDSFGFSINEPLGIALHKAIRKCKSRYRNEFFISNIVESIELDTRAANQTKDALINRLESAREWDMFEESKYREFWETLDPGSINVLDLSTIDSGRYGRRPLVVSVLCKDLFIKRTITRRREELGLVAEMPKVWLFIDEAHQYVPAGKTSLSKETLIRWVKEGRQPGLSLVIASQQPSAIDSEVLSQCDVMISHAITISDDKTALNRLTKDYMKGELKTYIDKIARVGQAILVDDFRESVSRIQIRPLMSKPGGGESIEK